MKQIIQYGALLAIVAGGVFGLTFLTQNTRTPVDRDPSKTASVSAAADADPLTIPSKSAVWDPDDDQYVQEFEIGKPGHYDFWVSNNHPEAVTVALLGKSCTCTDVQIGIVPVPEMDAWRKRTATVAPVGALLDMVGAPNIAGALAYNGFKNAVAWHELNRRDRDPSAPGVTIPPADAGGSPQWAILRMTWRADKPEAKNLTADIQHRIAAKVTDTQFSVRALVVPPAMMSAQQLNVGELSFNDRREATLYCWSSTRDDVSFTIEDTSHDPCIEAGPPKLLSADERDNIARELRAKSIIAPTKMRCAYAIPVVVWERRDGHQLELGPLYRRLAVRTDVAPETSVVALQGVVRGAIDVGEGADHDRVNMGTFRADRGKDTTVIVTAREPNLDLQVKSKSPDFLDVSLKPISGPVGFRQWKLTVGVDANKVSGLLPADSAVYLETKSNPPRSVRIPVVGNATVR